MVQQPTERPTDLGTASEEEIIPPRPPGSAVIS